MEDQADGGVTGLGIGARLRAARERAGYTVIEAAERLHMEPRMVEALDTEAFDVLGAPVYARGHLRRYAELVGEAASELQRLYVASLAPTAAPDLRQVPHRDRTPAAARSLAVPITIGFVIVAVVGVVAWMMRAARQPPATPLVRAGAASPVPAAPAAAAPAPAPAPDTPSGAAGAVPAAANAGPGQARAAVAAATPGANPPPEPVATRPRVHPAPAEVDAPAAVVAGPRPVELQLRFSADSWTEVYDADGHRLFYNVAAANTEQRLAGKAPMRVVLGHAPGVSVSINGRAATIPEAALRSDVADFVVSAAGRLATVR